MEIRGIELELEQRFSDSLKTTISANRNYGEKNGEKLTSISPSEVAFSLEWKLLDERLKLLGLASIIADGPDIGPTCGRSGRGECLTVDGHTTIDLYADYSITSRLSAKIGVENITDRKYWDWISVDGRSADDPELDLFLESGREFKAEVRYEF